MIDVKHIFELIKEKRIILENESEFRQIWKVDSHMVMIQIKKGRRVITCDCQNHGRFCNSSLCRHKEAVIAYPIVAEFLNQIEETKSSVSAVLILEKKLKGIIDPEFDDLVKLRWVKQLE